MTPAGTRRVLAAAAVAVALCALLAGCAKARHLLRSAPAPLPAATLAAAANGGSGCGLAAASGSVQDTVRSGGHSRVVIVHVPAGYTGKAPVALVLNLHGSQSTARAQEAFSGMDATSNADGFIVAYPQALIPDGSGFDWNIPGVPLVTGKLPPASAADDIAFLTSLVLDLEAKYCVDPHRVYATGMSGGGRMSSQLACDASQVFAAVAPVAGLREPTPCPAARAVPIIAFHGTADPVDPFNGNGLPYWTYSVPDAERMWAARDGCQTASPPVTKAAGDTLTTYARCEDGAAVELYAVTGEGHEWPGGPAMPRSITNALGPQSSAIDANTLMWAFFQDHPMP